MHEKAAIYAAVIAAIASLVSAIVSYLATRASSRSTARRDLLSGDLDEIGSLIYGIVALSHKMTSSKSDKKFSELREKANSIGRQIDTLRRGNRYSLWGLDLGFRVIQKTPNYIAHAKNNRNGHRANKIISKATKLRKALDKAIMHAYFNGKSPIPMHVWVIKYRANRLQKYFDSGAPLNAYPTGRIWTPPARSRSDSLF